MTKHTPGPWKAMVGEGAKSELDTICVIHEGPVAKRMICKVSPMDLRDEHDEGNAFLIAAAPELLEALERLEFQVSRAMSRETDEMSNLRDVDIDAARAAIAKARGEG